MGRSTRDCSDENATLLKPDTLTDDFTITKCNFESVRDSSIISTQYGTAVRLA